MDRKFPRVLCATSGLAALLIGAAGSAGFAGVPGAANTAQSRPAMEEPAAEAAAPNNGKPMSPATAAAFGRLKSLLGEWEGTTADGHAVRVSYRLISGNTCIEESIDHMGSDMVSIYCPDGEGLLMTHYCAANNQPRLRASKLSGDRNVLSFAYVDASNLPSDKSGHMHRLEVTFQDPDHFTQAWTYRNNGEDGTEKFTYSRKSG